MGVDESCEKVENWRRGNKEDGIRRAFWSGVLDVEKPRHENPASTCGVLHVQKKPHRDIIVPTLLGNEPNLSIWRYSDWEIEPNTSM